MNRCILVIVAIMALMGHAMRAIAETTYRQDQLDQMLIAGEPPKRSTPRIVTQRAIPMDQCMMHLRSIDKTLLRSHPAEQVADTATHHYIRYWAPEGVFGVSCGFGSLSVSFAKYE